MKTLLNNLSESWNRTFVENLTSNWVEEVKFFLFSRPHNRPRRTSALFVKATSVISESHLTWKWCLSKQTTSTSHFYIHSPNYKITHGCKQCNLLTLSQTFKNITKRTTLRIPERINNINCIKTNGVFIGLWLEW